MGRRAVSIWLPRLAAERAMRREGLGAETPLAVVEESRGALRLVSLSAAAEADGLRRGMALADARAVRPDLATRLADPPAEAAFLATLARWAERYTPWTAAEEGGDGLALDVTGCAHLLGGEAAMLADLVERLAVAGLTARAACADTRGAAWALARHGAGPMRLGGGAISAEAPASASRPPKERAASALRAAGGAVTTPVIAPPGGARAALEALPVTGLRIEAATAEELTRLGLGTIGEIARLPRGALARRFGVGLVRRLDQALGAEPEPVGVGRAAPRFAVRLSLPEPIGMAADVAAGLERLLARLSTKLAEHGAGARRVLFSARRVDGRDLHVEVALARPSRDPATLMELFERPAAELDAGFGIDALRLEAVETEPMAPRQHKGHAAAQAEAAARFEPGGDEGFGTLLSRLGGRLGFERLERMLPAESHAPSKAFTVASAAFAEPATRWPKPPGPRPFAIFEPEPVEAPEGAAPPAEFRWRGRRHRVAAAAGPERVAPEWWLDDPAWRTGPREYWRIETEGGERLWLHHAPRSERLDRWFAEGEFA